MSSSLLSVGEAAGRLDDDVDAERLPGERRRVLLLDDLDLPAVHDDRVVRVADLAREGAVGRVVLEEEGVRLHRHEVVDRDAELRAVALAEPADPRGEPLEGDLRAGLLDPGAQVHVVREKREHQLVEAGDVARVARERGPAERPLALAEERPDVRGDEAGEGERPIEAALAGLVANRVAVVEYFGALVHEADHGCHVRRHGLLRAAGELFGFLLGVLARRLHPVELEHHRPVPVDPEPAERLLDLLDRLRDLTARVGVLDAQQALAAVLARKQPVEQERADPTDVQEARRTRRHTYANSHRSVS